MAVPKILMLGVFLVLAICLASVSGCDEKADDGPKTADVKLDGKSFKLDLALEDQTRFRGLSGRAEIPADGGMLFVFPDSAVQQHSFVMRDCPVDIDIIYLDKTGRIVAMHEMKAETPRTDEEKPLSGGPGVPDWAKTNNKYEQRLKRYPSKFPAQFVIELKGGTISQLKLKNGDKIDVDTKGLKKRAK
ncbi:MAG: DUF192 domain-containing protein [Phycisphaerales bacterium]